MNHRFALLLMCAVLAVSGPVAAQTASSDPEAQPRSYFVTDFTDTAQLKGLGTRSLLLTARGVELPPASGEARTGRLRSSGQAFRFDANAVSVMWKEDRPAGTDVRIEVSVSRDGVRWGRWQAVEKDPHSVIHEYYPDGRPNPNYGYAAGTLLSWGLERYRFFRYRITLASEGEASPSVAALRLYYQDSTLGRDRVPEEKAGGYAQPSICDRTCWAARAPQCSISQLSAISRAVIHHTASQTDWNTTSQAESAANVRAHQNFHMDGNGWCDIGYNFLVDKLGNRFEGRQGAIASKPRGAHDGVNQDSIGISLMGYLHSPYNQVPTQAMRDAAYDLIAWKVEDPFDGYGSGSYGSLSNIGFVAGHRDVKSTACPGDEMYNSFIGTDFYGGEARDEVHSRVTGSGGVLTNGVPETGLGASTGGELRYTLDVPAGATNLVFTTTGSDPDADLYVKFGSDPTLSSFDCRSWTSSSNETCNIGTAQAGTYHVLVYAYSTFANLTLTGSYTAPGSCSYYDATSNLSGSSGSWSYYNVSVPSCASTLTVQISGGSGDADLYVKLGSQPSSSSFDCRPYLYGNNETCTFTPPQAGTYYIGLHGYSSYSGVTLEVDYQ